MSDTQARTRAGDVAAHGGTAPAADVEARSTQARETLAQIPLAYWLFVATLLLSVFSGNWGRLGLPIGLDRILLPAAFALLLLDPWSKGRPMAAVHWVMLAFAVLATCSLVLLGTIDSASVFALLDRVYLPLLFFAVAPIFVVGEARRTYFLRAFALFGLYLAVTSIAETFEIAALVHPGYILDAKHALEASGTGEVPRAGGPMLASEGTGMLTAMCAVIAAFVAARERGGWRIIATLTVPLCLFAAFLSMTRSVWLGTALGIAAAVLLQRRLWRWIPLMAVAAVAALVLGAALLPGLAEIAMDRGSTSRSVYDRFNTNAAGVRIVQELPLTGIGWGEFIRTGPSWVRQSDAYPLTSVNIEIHNVFLSRAAELGLPAAALFVLCIVLGPLTALYCARAPQVRGWRSLLAALACIWLVPSMLSPVPYPLPTFLMWTVAGIVYGMSDTSSSAHTDRSPAGRPACP